MKRLITVAVLLACIVAACVVGQTVISDCGEKVGVLLTEGVEAAQAGDIEVARQKALEAEKAFMQKEQWLDVFVHRDLVENLGSQLARLSHLAEEETIAEYRSEAASALVMLTHVVNDERPMMLNIL